MNALKPEKEAAPGCYSDAAAKSTRTFNMRSQFMRCSPPRQSHTGEVKRHAAL
jgi:hypothetical protein